jgi:hypothetical protein
VRFLGAAVRHFHNLTELAADALQPGPPDAGAERRRPRAAHQLPDAVEARSNLAMFQARLVARRGARLYICWKSLDQPCMAGPGGMLAVPCLGGAGVGDCKTCTASWLFLVC